ncbi:DUF7848 domain-containing protein [Streptomyces sp. NBC_01498]|uniref:DUF7848 domain-containing protein n=1 Tax=Streptomyces sp. NBC_01498 TaxID=2975870 RepID=UPI003FCDA2EE
MGRATRRRTFADSDGGVEREGGRGQPEVGTVTPRSVLRYETWSIQPDREPDAEPVLYASSSDLPLSRTASSSAWRWAMLSSSISL